MQAESTLNEYQEATSKFSRTDREWESFVNNKRYQQVTLDYQLLNYALGIAGEAGEVVDLIKKHIFHGHELDTNKILDECGDVMWYLAQLLKVIGHSLDTAALANISKLEARYGDKFSNEKSINRIDK